MITRYRFATSRSLLICSPKLSRTLCGVKEIFVFILVHIIAEAIHTLYIDTSFGSVPKPLVFGKCLNPIHISELIDIRLAYAHFHKGDEERHHDAEGIRGELKGGNIEVLKHCNEEMMKQKRSSLLHDRLAESHHTRMRKMRSLIWARLMDFFPQPKLAGYKF